MVSVTAALMINLLHLDSAFDDETLENLIDQAIDSLNLYGDLELPRMSGTAGSKTVELTTKQKGAVGLVLRAFYNAFYENPDGSISVGSVSISSSDILANKSLLDEIKFIARTLYKRENDLDVSIG